ncbi:hypothetical protein DH2020_023386 [Rehmannia glutinosa]|uniref:PGG domain-containing protein n=1 Tax=Rehmannia glutinosa TaxID=99300 RepID=A0ABR0W5W0_REHGL
MDRNLIEAAKKGDVQKLHNLIKDDIFLFRAGDNLLHIACIGGHVEFVEEILNLNPEFAEELNQDCFSPLHIASATGDIETVKELLKLGSNDLCLVKGKEKRIPLHYAVIKGRIKVIRELISVCLGSVKEVTARGENCFHLAIKNNQFEAFKVLFEHVVSFDEEFVLKSKDEHGNTILHLATSRKQYEVVDMLLDHYKAKLEVNSLNKKGLTPLDVLASQGGDFDIEEMLRLAGAVRIQEIHSFPQVATQDPPHNQLGHDQERNQRSKSASKKLQDYFQYDIIKDSPSKARNTLLVIAVLIATATYQAVLSPPGGVWQDDFWPDAKNKTTYDSSSKKTSSHIAGQAVLGTRNQVSYSLFLISNSVGFFMSLHMMSFLTHGLPLQFELRVALFALASTYDTCMIAITPSGGISVYFIVLSVLMSIGMPLLTKVVRDYKKRQRQCDQLPSTRDSNGGSNWVVPPV